MSEVHILGSRIMGLGEQLKMRADNVANVSTHGFKRLSMDFEELLARKGGTDVGSYTKGIGVLVDHTPSTVEKTGNPFDLALSGEGFFAVQTPGGTQYTRNGNFSMSATGQMVSAEGYPVLDNANAPINIPIEARMVIISRDGLISTEAGALVNIGVFQFSDTEKQQLIRAGNNGFMAPTGVVPQTVVDPPVMQGHLETSNVNNMLEIVSLQELSRAYQSAFRSMNRIEDLEERAIRELSQVGR
jgi:flagellar basal-body rod protein FlgF